MNNRVKVRIYNATQWDNPAYATPESSGFDLRAFIDKPISLEPGERALIPTGIYMQLPPFFECQIRPRSGLANKSGISIVNSPGTVDSDYRGQIHANLINLGDSVFTIYPGDKIAQGVIMPVYQAEWDSVLDASELSSTLRGANGHGSTGVRD